MSGRWQIKCPKCDKRFSWTGPMAPPPPCPHCHPESKQPEEPVELTGDVAAVLEQCESLLASIGDLPERASDFAESVGEKVRGIMETIEERRYVTDGQKTALDNIESGVDRWFR
jgi:hypothetical protein